MDHKYSRPLSHCVSELSVSESDGEVFYQNSEENAFCNEQFTTGKDDFNGTQEIPTNPVAESARRNDIHSQGRGYIHDVPDADTFAKGPFATSTVYDDSWENLHDEQPVASDDGDRGIDKIQL